MKKNADSLWKGRQAIRPADVAAVVKSLKAGRMPRADTRLGKLCLRVEAGLFTELGEGMTTSQAIKVGLILQHLVLIAGLPLFAPNGRDPHPAYKWAVDGIRALLDELDGGKRGGKKGPKPRTAAPNLAAILGGEDDE